MAANYLDIRHAHYRLTLRGWLRGLDKALIALAAALTFILTALIAMAVFGMAQALLLLTDPSVDAWHRIGVVAAWQALSFALLRATREAALMPKASVFFDSLPVSPTQKLRADVVLALCTYSFLWLPVAWVIADPLGARLAPLPGTVALLTELAVASVCLNLTLLRSRLRHALICGGALVAFAALQGNAVWLEIARATCTLAAAFALWTSYQPDAARAPSKPRRHALFDRVALATGLVAPLLANELRANLAVRCGAILATLAACLVVIEVRTNDTSQSSVLLFVSAMATLALYSLPALIRRTLLTKLQFLAGQPGFAQRMRAPVYLLPSAIFGAALVLGWIFDRADRAAIDAGTFTVLYLIGVIGTRLELRVMPWFMPFTVTIAVIILGAMT